MTIKTISVYSCTIFCILIIIISLATNYWLEMEEPGDKKIAKDMVQHYKIGLFEICKTRYYNHGKDNHDDGQGQGCDSFNPEGIDGWAARRDTLIAMFIIALILTLVAFIFANVYCVTGKYYFPVGRCAVCYFISALLMTIALLIYTSTFYGKMAFSWSYGAAWSCIAMYIVTIILLYADK